MNHLKIWPQTVYQIDGAPGGAPEGEDEPAFSDLEAEAAARLAELERLEEEGLDDGQSDDGAGDPADAAEKPDITGLSLEEILALRPDLAEKVQKAGPLENTLDNMAAADQAPKFPSRDEIKDKVFEKYADDLEAALLDPRKQFDLHEKMRDEIAEIQQRVDYDKGRYEHRQAAIKEKDARLERIVTEMSAGDEDVAKALRAEIVDFDPEVLAFVEKDEKQKRQLSLMAKGLAAELGEDRDNKSSRSSAPRNEPERAAPGRASRLSDTDSDLLEIIKQERRGISDADARKLLNSHKSHARN